MAAEVIGWLLAVGGWRSSFREALDSSFTANRPRPTANRFLMHLVFLNQYYPPDAAPTGVMLEGLVEKLARDGHEVTVLCAAGGYARAKRGDVGGGRLAVGCEEDVGGGPMGESLGSAEAHPPTVDRQQPTANRQQPTANRQPPTVLRLPASRFGRGTFIGKLLDYASYYVGVAWKLMVLHPKPDRIVALTTPPFLSVLARLLSKIRGADHAHWVMDLYPDVMAAHGMLGEKSLAYRILAGLARWGFGGRRCVAVLTLGPDMAERCGRVVGGQLAVSSGQLAVGCGRLAVNEEQSASRKLDRQPPTANRPPPTANRQPPTVSWVPLWGTECSGASATVAGCPGRREGERDAAESDTPAFLPHPSPMGIRATVTDAPLHTSAVGPSSNSSICLSTINPQLSTSSALRRKRGWADDELIVMYSGNMGLGHRFGEILAAAGRLAVGGGRLDVGGDEFQLGAQARPPTANGQPFRFAFFGGGRRRAEVEEFVRNNPGCAVELHDYAPAEDLAAHLQSADVHLASLDAAWTGTMVPSKLQGIFAAGRPVIFIGSAESSIGRWVVESGGGWVVPPGDVNGLLAALNEARQPDARLTRGRAARVYAREHFDKVTNVARVAAVLAAES